MTVCGCFQMLQQVITTEFLCSFVFCIINVNVKIARYDNMVKICQDTSSVTLSTADNPESRILLTAGLFVAPSTMMWRYSLHENCVYVCTVTTAPPNKIKVWSSSLNENWEMMICPVSQLNIQFHQFLVFTWMRSIQTLPADQWKWVVFICLSILIHGPWRVSCYVAWRGKLKLSSKETAWSPGSHFWCDLKSL